MRVARRRIDVRFSLMPRSSEKKGVRNLCSRSPCESGEERCQEPLLAFALRVWVGSQSPVIWSSV
jgi:hypothetical protein